MQIITVTPPQGHNEINNLGRKSRFEEHPRTAGTMPVWQPKADFAAHLTAQSSAQTPIFTHNAAPNATPNTLSNTLSDTVSNAADNAADNIAATNSTPPPASPRSTPDNSTTQHPAPATNHTAPSFADFIDIINPLHHLPIIGHIYRHITGDEISPMARFAGGVLFGGPLGAGSALATMALNDIRNPQNNSQNSVAAGFNGNINANAQNPNFTLKPRYQFDKMPRMAGTTHISAQNMR